MKMESAQKRTNFLQYLSWRGWGLIRYNSIWQNVSLLFYIGIVERRFDLKYIRDVMLFLALSLAGTAYGYLVNDLADVELDRRAGKSNVFQRSGRVQIVAVIGTSVALLVILGWPFVQYPGFVPLWITWFLATTFYSMPPVRLKERGLLGLVTTMVAQQPLPAAMAVAALGGGWSWGTQLFILYITLRGICSDVGHQMRDRARDQLAGARTFAVAKGHGFIARFYAVTLELEAVALGAVLIVLAVDLPTVVFQGWRISPMWPILALYIVLFAGTAGRAWRRLSRGLWIDPYDESPEGPPRDLLHFLHMTFPTVLLPLFLALWLTLRYWPNVIFLLGLVFMYRLYDPRRWRKAWSAFKGRLVS